MKSKIFLFVMTFFCIISSYAEKVDIEKAEKVARSYVRTVPRLASKTNIQLSRTVSKELKSNNTLRSYVEDTMYYVFSMNNTEGFIIVSADDVAVPVLGYSELGSYDDSNPNFSYWMECLSQEIASAIENHVTQSAEVKAKWDAYLSDNATTLRASNVVVYPLIQTQWDQGTPYNDSCPKINGTIAVTGCVATAMAQIMKYWNYPATGTGTNSYTPPAPYSGPSLSVNFGNITYDWGNMTNSYTASSTVPQKSAIATLMYHCGVSVNMQYDLASAGGSGAFNEAVGPALVKYFKYDAGVNILYRNDNSYSAWLNIIKTELDASRPVLYSGQGKGGHSFVCDGYDSDNLFHFNWGWSGVSDGYFEMSALNPQTLGIGGGAGGYNSDQNATIGIQPNKNLPATISLTTDSLTASVPSLSNITQTFNVTAKNLINWGSSFSVGSFNIGLLLCQIDNTPVQPVYYKSQSNSFSLDAYSFDPNNGNYSYDYFSSQTIYSGYSLPPSLPVGTYKLYPALSTSADPNTPIIIQGNNGNNFILVQVISSSSILLSNGAAIAPNLSLVSLGTVGTLYQNRIGKFMATVSNNGQTDYNSKMAIRLNGTVIDTEPVVIPAGTQKAIGFSGTIGLAPTVSPNTYPLTLWYDPKNNQSAPSVQFSLTQNVTVQATPDSAALSATLSFSTIPVPANNPKLSVKITNTGGVFDGTLIAYIFPMSGGSSIGSFGSIAISLEQGKDTTLVFNEPTALPPPGPYFTSIYTSSSFKAHPYGGFINSLNFTLVAPVYPSINIATWMPTANPSDWNNPNNWAPYGIPSSTATVTIPKSSSYPLLQAATTVDTIQFGPGAELGRQDLLTYNKAFVALDFSSTGLARGQWHLLSMPIAKVVTGDFSFGGYPYTFLRKFTITTVGAIQEAGWESYSDNNIELKIGEGFALWVNDGSTGTKGYSDSGSGTDSPMFPQRNYGLGQVNGIIQLPYFENQAVSDAHRIHRYDKVNSKSIFYVMDVSTNNLPLIKDSVGYTRGADAYRLAPSSSMNIPANFGADGSSYFALVGNPFMSTIDFERFYESKKDTINENYQIWTGAGFSVYGPNGVSGIVGVGTLTQYIAPMQSFFVQKNSSFAGTGGAVTLNFNLINISASQNPSTLRSSSTEDKTLNKLNILASNDKYKVLTYIAQREYGSDKLSDADSRKIIPGMSDVPEIYTLKDSGNGSKVAVGSNIVNSDILVPLGLATAYKGQLLLTFSGMDKYDSKITLIDLVANKEIDLTGKAAYDYSFDYVPKKSGNEVEAEENRFLIKINKVQTGIGTAADDLTSVYAGKNVIYAVSSLSNPIQEIEVYNLQGGLLYSGKNLNAAHCTVALDSASPQICLVRLVTGQGVKMYRLLRASPSQ